MQFLSLLITLTLMCAVFGIFGGPVEAIFRLIYKAKGLKWDDNE